METKYGGHGRLRIATSVMTVEDRVYGHVEIMNGARVKPSPGSKILSLDPVTIVDECGPEFVLSTLHSEGAPLAPPARLFRTMKDYDAEQTLSGIVRINSSAYFRQIETKENTYDAYEGCKTQVIKTDFTSQVSLANKYSIPDISAPGFVWIADVCLLSFSEKPNGLYGSRCLSFENLDIFGQEITNRLRQSGFDCQFYGYQRCEYNDFPKSGIKSKPTANIGDSEVRAVWILNQSAERPNFELVNIHKISRFVKEVPLEERRL